MFGIYGERGMKPVEITGPRQSGGGPDYVVFFCRANSVVFIKLKDNKKVSGFSQTQQYFILFYHDAYMFRSLGYHQAIFTKLSVRYMQCLPIHRKN